MQHFLKIKSEFLELILQQKKTFEIRENDRGVFISLDWWR